MAAPKKGALAQFMVPMVDATDFASIESAVTESDFNSGATRKFFGVNHGVSDAFTSGTISKAGRLVRSGVFQITLKGTENNYDRMQVRVNKTGCAEQIYEWENVDNDDSDVLSAITIGNSRILLVQSRLSDFDSRVLVGVPLDASTLSDLRSAIAAGPAATVTASDISDIASAVWAHSTRKLTSNISLNASDLSDLRSAISAGAGATVTASDISDIASAVWAHVAGTRVDSRVLLNLSRISDVYSAVIAGVALDASTMSDLRSAITAGVGAVTVSNISDIASAVWAHTIGARVDSRVLLNQSRISDVYSLLSDFQSDFGSRVPKRVATDSQLSDALSDLRSALTVGVAITVSGMSDLASQVWAHAIGARVDSRVLLNQSRISDIYSLLTTVASNVSDVESQIDAGVELGASSLSDLRSAIAGQAFDASDLSDIASAVWATARVEPTAVITSTGTMKTGLEWLVALSRNKITQTATVQSLRNDADAADIASAAVSDDGTTFIRAEWS